MHEDQNQNYDLTPIEKLAVNTINSAFERNKTFHQPFHEKQYRLYEFVRNLTPEDKIVIEGRSNIQIGMAWMLHNIAFSILKNSITSSDDMVHLEATPLSGELIANDEMDEYLSNMFIDEVTDIKSIADDSLWDVVATGSSVLSPSFNHQTKKVLQDVPKLIQGVDTGQTQQQEAEIIYKSCPDFDKYAPWDVFPTAGVSDYRDLHELILLKRRSPQQLREWERHGFISGVDKMFELMDRKVSDSNDSGGDKERVPLEQDENDRYGNIDVLIYWGLFPLYKHQEYVDDDGKDRSADEVECLIIKPKNLNFVLALQRNPFYHQLKPGIISRYSRVPGEIWGVGFTEIAEQMLIHQQDWFNLMQDAANKEIYRDEIMPDEGCEEIGGAAGAGKRFYISIENLQNGVKPQYIERGPSVLPEVYNQRDYMDNIIKQVTGVVDFVKGITEGAKKTATEVAELAENVNIRFKETAIYVESDLIRPMFNWAVSLLSQYSDDEYVMAYTGLPFNPFKQFDPMLPNLLYRVKLEGALRASESVAHQQVLQALIGLAQGVQPMPDDDGKLIVPNTTLMIFDLMKAANIHRDIDRYKLEVTPEMMAAMQGGGDEQKPGNM